MPQLQSMRYFLVVDVQRDHSFDDLSDVAVWAEIRLSDRGRADVTAYKSLDDMLADKKQKIGAFTVDDDGKANAHPGKVRAIGVAHSPKCPANNGHPVCKCKPVMYLRLEDENVIVVSIRREVLDQLMPSVWLWSDGPPSRPRLVHSR